MVVRTWSDLTTSFYPGIGIPTVQLIGAGSSPMPVGAIDAPEGLEVSSSPKEEETGKVATQNKHSRAPRVTGSFDHAVLPMPPVRLALFFFSF